LGRGRLGQGVEALQQVSAERREGLDELGGEGAPLLCARQLLAPVRERGLPSGGERGAGLAGPTDG
jgi:hypothetical protein